jgi:hypothetical protein
MFGVVDKGLDLSGAAINGIGVRGVRFASFVHRMGFAQPILATGLSL